MAKRGNNEGSIYKRENGTWIELKYPLMVKELVSPQIAEQNATNG